MRRGFRYYPKTLDQLDVVDYNDPETQSIALYDTIEGIDGFISFDNPFNDYEVLYGIGSKLSEEERKRGKQNYKNRES